MHSEIPASPNECLLASADRLRKQPNPSFGLVKLDLIKSGSYSRHIAVHLATRYQNGLVRDAKIVPLVPGRPFGFAES